MRSESWPLPNFVRTADMKLSASAICVWAFSALSLWQQVSAEHLSYNTRERRQAINKGNVALLARATQAASNVTINSPSGKSYNVISDGNVGTNLYATAAVEMSSYLTYTVFTNATDSSGQWLFEDAKNMCLDFCERTAGCVTANLYRESNNPLLDWVFMEKSNTKCALFSSVVSTSMDGSYCRWRLTNPHDFTVGAAYLKSDPEQGTTAAEAKCPALDSNHEVVGMVAEFTCSLRCCSLSVSVQRAQPGLQLAISRPQRHRSRQRLLLGGRHLYLEQD